MKARNPNTEQLEKVYVKALDSMPVGSVIDFTGSSANVPAGWEEVYDYSTTEVNTGKKWIDGKPIYRKVLVDTYSTTGSSAFTKNLDVGSSVDTMISYDGIYYELAGVLANHINKLGTMTISGVNYQSTFYYHKQANVIQVGLSGKSSVQTVKFVVIVEYTKTTD